jgi:phosphoribosylglycinamide formyltransferase-1
MPFTLGVLASGEGTTLQSIVDACAHGRIQGNVGVVISNNSGSGALRRARAAGIPVHHLSSVTHQAPQALDAAIKAALVDARVDVVFLAGYLKRLGPDTLATFRGLVLNTHPALLPKFGGTGMFGDRVFEAVLASGDSESGVSVHVVDEHYDAGPLVQQARMPIEAGESLASLKARTQACERELVVQTLAAIALGELRLGDRPSMAP